MSKRWMERAARRRHRKKAPRRTRRGWIPQSEWRGSPNPVQMSVCNRSGERYLRTIIGRFRHLPGDALQTKRQELESAATAILGHVPPCQGEPWFVVEFLDNVLDFHLRPPCGCPPANRGAN